MKTLEEKAVDYMVNLTCEDAADPVEMVQQAYLTGAKEALCSQWRSVEDELPEDGEKCVIMDKDGRVRAVIYDAKTKHWDINMGSITYRYRVKTTLYWMPIPELKKEK